MSWSIPFSFLIGQPYWTVLFDNRIGQPYWTTLLLNLRGNCLLILLLLISIPFYSRHCFPIIKGYGMTQFRCLVHVVVKFLVTDYIQKRRGQAFLFSFEYNLSQIWYQSKSDKENGILLPKLFWPTVRKNCSSDQEKLLKEAESREFAKFYRWLEQFIQTVKGQNNF